MGGWVFKFLVSSFWFLVSKFLGFWVSRFLVSSFWFLGL